MVSTILRCLGTVLHRGPNVLHPVPHLPLFIDLSHKKSIQYRTTNFVPPSANLSQNSNMPGKDWIIIGISGVTCGGKTTLANKLKNALTPVYVFHQDKYFYPDDSPKHIKCEGLDHNDYDVLSSLDMETMYDDITKTLSGEDRSHANRLEGTSTVAGTKFLVIEGFTVLNYKPIMEICDLR